MRRMFSSFRNRNYRLFFTGQVISFSGNWMHSVALAWLVLELTGSGTALGVVVALPHLPLLLFGPFGGLVADRFEKRHTLYIANSIAAAIAITLGLLVLFDVIRLWMVYILATGLGFVTLFEHPARHTFVVEVVGPGDLTNAVSLNSVLVNVARMIGPAAAAALILSVGMAPCFLLNGASYLAAAGALALMRADLLQPAPRHARRRGQVREGFRYVSSTPDLLIPLLMMAVIGTLAYEYHVSLPLFAKFTFGGDAGTYGMMSALMGAGAVAGGLATAAGGRRRSIDLSITAVVFGVLQVGAAASPTLWMAMAALVLLGAASIRFLALGNSILQLTASPEMRGRVMALWSVAFLGSTPVGGPVIGWIGEHVGPRYSLGLGGIATLLCGLLAYRALAGATRRRTEGDCPDVEVPA